MPSRGDWARHPGMTCRFDTYYSDVQNGHVTTKVKRTYNLSAETVRRVRELASDYGVADSQDRVVELAIDRLYGEQRDEEEAARWTAAANDPEFRAEIASIREGVDD